MYDKKNIQMYEKEHAYKCMTKTGIQMYDKNRHFSHPENSMLKFKDINPDLC